MSFLVVYIGRVHKQVLELLIGQVQELLQWLMEIGMQVRMLTMLLQVYIFSLNLLQVQMT